MGLIEFIAKVCVEDAVYWGSPKSNGYGINEFSAPREIKVRWTDKQQTVTGGDGKEAISVAEVLVQEDLETGGLLYHGTLDDFTPLQLLTPYELSGVLEIKAKDKIPLFRSTTKFVRTVYLSARTNKSTSF